MTYITEADELSYGRNEGDVPPLRSEGAPEVLAAAAEEVLAGADLVELGDLEELARRTSRA